MKKAINFICFLLMVLILLLAYYIVFWDVPMSLVKPWFLGPLFSHGIIAIFLGGILGREYAKTMEK